MTREEAKEFLIDVSYKLGNMAVEYLTEKDGEKMLEAIKALEQEPKTGHWILKRTFPTKLYNEHLNEYKCSECYRGIRCTESQLVNYPYCHCGCRMIEPQERSDKKWWRS